MLFLWQGSGPPAVDWRAALLPAVYLGAFSTCLCYLLQTVAQKHTSATRAGLLLSTEGLFGSVFSVALGMNRLRSICWRAARLFLPACCCWSFSETPPGPSPAGGLTVFHFLITQRSAPSREGALFAFTRLNSAPPAAQSR